MAATKCLTESQDVFAKSELWKQMKAALDAKLKGAEQATEGVEAVLT